MALLFCKQFQASHLTLPCGHTGEEQGLGALDTLNDRERPTEASCTNMNSADDMISCD